MSQQMITALWIFVVGLIFGSFLNVCIYRLPRRISVIRPRSHCPHCGVPIRPWDNVPIVSFLILRGRCRHCGHPISPRYPVIEFLSGMLFLAAYLHAGPGLAFVRYVVLGSALLVGTFIDLDHQLLPDSITLPTLAFGLVTAFLDGVQPGLRSLLGAVTGAAAVYLIAVFGQALFHQDSMGGGDLKLVAAIGAYLGWSPVLGMLLLSFFLAAPVTIIGMATRKIGASSKVPFGPFIAVATYLVMFWGPQLWRAYVNAVAG